MSKISYLKANTSRDPAYLEHFGLARSPFIASTGQRPAGKGLEPERVEEELGHALAKPGVTVLSWTRQPQEVAVIERIAGRLGGDIPLARFAGAPRKASLFLAQTLQSFGFDEFSAVLPEYRNVLTAFLRHKAQTNEVAVVLIEQAESLTEEVLDEIVRLMRSRSADSNVHFVFLARPEFVDRTLQGLAGLDCRTLEFAAAQSVAVADYVFGRLNASGLPGRSLFTPPAIKHLDEISGGEPALIDNVCHMALELAFAEQASKINKRMVEEARRICTHSGYADSRDAEEVMVLEFDPETPAKPRHSSFVMTRAGRRITRFELTRERLTIGRHRSNDIYIPRPGISLFHAIVVLEGAEVFLFDLRSTNGTYINGQEVSRRKLRDGDEVFFGSLSLVFCQGSAGISGESRDSVLPGFTETVVLEETDTKDPTVYLQSLI